MAEEDSQFVLDEVPAEDVNYERPVILTVVAVLGLVYLGFTFLTFLGSYDVMVAELNSGEIAFYILRSLVLLSFYIEILRMRKAAWMLLCLLFILLSLMAMEFGEITALTLFFSP